MTSRRGTPCGRCGYSHRLNVACLQTLPSRLTELRRPSALQPHRTDTSWPCPRCQGVRGLDCRICYGAGYYSAVRFSWGWRTPGVTRSSI